MLVVRAPSRGGAAVPWLARSSGSVRRLERLSVCSLLQLSFHQTLSQFVGSRVQPAAQAYCLRHPLSFHVGRLEYSMQLNASQTHAGGLRAVSMRCGGSLFGALGAGFARRRGPLSVCSPLQPSAQQSQPQFVRSRVQPAAQADCLRQPLSFHVRLLR